MTAELPGISTSGLASNPSPRATQRLFRMDWPTDSLV